MNSERLKELTTIKKKKTKNNRSKARQADTANKECGGNINTVVPYTN